MAVDAEGVAKETGAPDRLWQEAREAVRRRHTFTFVWEKHRYAPYNLPREIRQVQ